MTPTYINLDGERVEGFKTPYNHSTTAEANATALTCKDKSLTQQNFKDQCDINHIVELFMKTGQLPGNIQPPIYADLTTMEDYHTLQNRLAEVNARFYELEPAIRADYQNDPGQWLQDVNERLAAGDREGLRKMGLDVPDAPTPDPAQGGTPAPGPTGTPPQGA